MIRIKPSSSYLTFNCYRADNFETEHFILRM